MSDLFKNYIVGFFMRWLITALHQKINENKLQCSKVDNRQAPLSHRESGGLVVERRTLNQEVLGLIPTGGTIWYP